MNSPSFRLWCRSPYRFDADLASSLPHCVESGVLREPGNWLRQVFVERVTALLLNLAGLWRILIAMAPVETRFLHMLSFLMFDGEKATGTLSNDC